MPSTPEQQARVEIDRLLAAAGWQVCGVSDVNIHGASGVAVRKFPLTQGYGFAVHLLYLNCKAARVIFPDAPVPTFVPRGVMREHFGGDDTIPKLTVGHLVGSRGHWMPQHLSCRTSKCRRTDPAMHRAVNR